MDETGPRFDVFLSHNSKDQPAVVALAERLQAEGLRVWLDLWELRPGHPWQEALEEIIEATGAAAVLVGKDGIGPWENAEMRACLDEFARRKLPVIPVLLPGCPERPVLPLLLRRFTWVDLRGGPDEDGFRRLVWGITGRKPVEQRAAMQPAAPVPPAARPPAAGQPAVRSPPASPRQTSPRVLRWLVSPWAILATAMIFLGGGVAMWQWGGGRPEPNSTESTTGDHPTKLETGAASKPVRPTVEKSASPEGPAARASLLAQEMVSVPGGEFWMGTDKASAPDAQDDERPRHKVTIKPFRIGKYEVTQGQWRRVMGNNPSYFSGCGDDCPVENVSFDLVGAFIRKLNADTGKSYRLPTEAEWEYACRSGGREQKYCGGEDLDRLAWHLANAGRKTHAVGGKAPNGLGLHDLSGNVWEWTCSAYTEAYDGGESECAGGGRRVVRGGSWTYDPRNLRSAYRFWNTPDFRNNDLGFRLAQD